ncbi:MAG: polysaccharide pyruvyl transferase family protein [Candidatus Omnitrophota bacterium]
MSNSNVLPLPHIFRKNLGILTLHSGLNEGAILQALALSRHLARSIPGSQVEIIDFRYSQKITAYGPLINQRHIALFNFASRALPLSKNRMIQPDRTGLYQKIEQEYNLLILGSDEIWKLKYEKGWLGLTKQCSPWHPAFPNAYWPEKISIPVIAYAPSIGRTDITTIPRRHRIQMEKCMRHFTLLSYRDEKTLQFLEWLSPAIAQKAVFVPDPVFTLPLDQIQSFQENVKFRLMEKGINFDRPLLGIILDPSEETNNALRFFRKKGYQIIAFSYPNVQCDLDLSSEAFNPLEWMGLFQCMDICLSCRFHGCISCLMGNVPFIGIDQYNSKSKNTKIRSLLKTFDLEKNYFNEYLREGKSLKQICEALLEQPWPTDSISKKIDQLRNLSNVFAEKILNIITPEYETVRK